MATGCTAGPSPQEAGAGQAEVMLQLEAAIVTALEGMKSPFRSAHLRFRFVPCMVHNYNLSHPGCLHAGWRHQQPLPAWSQHRPKSRNGFKWTTSRAASRTTCHPCCQVCCPSLCAKLFQRGNHSLPPMYPWVVHLSLISVCLPDGLRASLAFGRTAAAQEAAANARQAESHTLFCQVCTASMWH